MLFQGILLQQAFDFCIVMNDSCREIPFSFRWGACFGSCLPWRTSAVTQVSNFAGVSFDVQPKRDGIRPWMSRENPGGSIK